ncbi:hypothetical protein EVAR_87723_1 [Eumeta japonica]|uniref:Uncharacterized protein n=1 Tax=Eumeta variegata TaxID=151549 RepID=A0A4C1TET0_EUMVA|nr:hypothetical protein EVAR_87723_1 [Eumeta japonica]
MIGRKSKMSLLNKRTLYTMCIRPVMTYACPVLLTPPRLHSKTFRDLELPTLSKFMKDASERFFSIAINHTNPLISAAASYEAPPENHFLRRPRNASQTRQMTSLAESTVNGYNSRGAFRTPASLKVPTRVVTFVTPYAGRSDGSPVGESRADGICMSIGRVR